jgi:hypothetical protein
MGFSFLLGVVVLDRAGRCFAVIPVGFGEDNSAWIRNPAGISLFALNLRRATGTAMTIINFRPLLSKRSEAGAMYRSGLFEVWNRSFE